MLVEVSSLDRVFLCAIVAFERGRKLTDLGQSGGQGHHLVLTERLLAASGVRKSENIPSILSVAMLCNNDGEDSQVEERC